MKDEAAFGRILASLHDAARDPGRWPRFAAVVDEASGRLRRPQVSSVAAIIHRLAFAALLAPLALADPATERRLLAAAVADLYAALDGATVRCEALETAYRQATGCRQDAIAMSRHQCWVAGALVERGAHGGVPRQLRESVERLEILRAEPGCPPPDP